MYVSHVCVPDVQEGQKRVLDFLELELQAACELPNIGPGKQMWVL